MSKADWKFVLGVPNLTEQGKQVWESKVGSSAHSTPTLGQSKRLCFFYSTISSKWALTVTRGLSVQQQQYCIGASP